VQPQHSLPDVILWMICEKNRIAYCKFPAEDLIYAVNDMIGKNCGKIQTVFLKVLLFCFMLHYCTSIMSDNLVLFKVFIQHH